MGLPSERPRVNSKGLDCMLCVAERIAAFRPHAGIKSVPQELGAGSNGAWRRRLQLGELHLLLRGVHER